MGEIWQEFLLLAVAHVFAVASPGADFAVVLKNTLVRGRKHGTVTAIGVGLGILVHVTYTLLGVSVVLKHFPFVFDAVKIIGALYLSYLGIQGLRSRARKSRTSVEQKPMALSLGNAFRTGFLTNVLNPKVTLFFVALFTSIVSSEREMIIQVGYGLWLSLYTMLWFAFVAWIFSRQRILSWYESHGHYFDRAMGVFLIYLALKLLVDSV